MMQAKFEAQWKLIYSILVAGKSARFAQQKTEDLLDECSKDMLPLDYLSVMLKAGKLDALLRSVKTGSYRRLSRCFSELLQGKDTIDLFTCTPEELEEIHGIGAKTSRFFIMWIRPEEEYAALDVHVLRWMREQGYNAPKSTPTYPKYTKLERAFIGEAKKRGKTPRELDYEIWIAYNKSGLRRER